MYVTQLIAQLRTVLTSYSNRIGGVAELQAAEDLARLTFPSLYVLYAGTQATTVNHQSELRIDTDNRFKIIAVVDNTTDRTGMTSQDEILTLRTQILSALLNYTLDSNCQTLEFVGDKMLKQDKARYFHEFEFKMIGLLDPTDGYQYATDKLNKVYTDIDLVESQSGDHPDAQANISGLNP